jgi:hypothetical protein
LPVDLKEPAYYANDNRYQNTKHDHGGDGKIKAEILFFNADITGQVADPVQFVVEEIDDKPYYHHSAPDEHNILAGIGIHKKIILITAQCFCR